MNRSGKFPKLIIAITAFFMFGMMMFAGCAAESVQVEFPNNHPANPQAQETQFAPPPNPFQKDVAVMKKEPEADSMMKHKTHDESGKQHMDHNMGKDKKSPPASESTKKSGHEKSDHQHKGHSQ